MTSPPIPTCSSIIAMDQRNTLRRMFTAVGLDASDDDLRTAKADVARVLTPPPPACSPIRPTASRPLRKRRRSLRTAVCSSPPNRRSGAPTKANRAPTATPTWTPVGSGPGRRRPEVLRPAARRPPGPAPGEPDLVAEDAGVCEEIIRDCRATGVPWSSRTWCTRDRAKTSAAGPARTRSSSRPGP